MNPRRFVIASKPTPRCYHETDLYRDERIERWIPEWAKPRKRSRIVNVLRNAFEAVMIKAARRNI